MKIKNYKKFKKNIIFTLFIKFNKKLIFNNN